jgi:hypothetical protein
VRRIVTLAAAIALAAVVASAPDPAKTVGTTTTLDVTKSKIGTPPPDFDFLQTGEGEPGRWTMVRDVTAIDGTAIEHVSTDQHENRYSLAIYAPVSTKDFKLSVRFNIMKGTMQAAGVAVRFLNVGSYYLVSASALKERLDLYRIVNGKRNGYGERMPTLSATVGTCSSFRQSTTNLPFPSTATGCSQHGIARCRARDRLDCGPKRTTSRDLTGSRSKLFRRRRNAVVGSSEVSLGQ